VEAREPLFTAIFSGIREMPLTMRRLAWVQFSAFGAWPTLHVDLLHAGGGARDFRRPAGDARGSARGWNGGGVCFATYDGVAFGVAFLLVWR
jgi:uncharacterized membrane protein